MGPAEAGQMFSMEGHNLPHPWGAGRAQGTVSAFGSDQCKPSSRGAGGEFCYPGTVIPNWGMGMSQRGVFLPVSHLGASAPCRCLSCSVWDLRAVVGRSPPSLARGNWLLIELLLLLHSFLGSVIK